LVRVVPAADVTVVVNTADDIELHGLHISPDVDSVTYWLGDVADRERGWGRRGESFRAVGELRAFDPDAAWFGLGDLDLATHLFRTRLLDEGRSLSEVTAAAAARFGIECRILPMTDDPVTTRVEVVDADGSQLDLHFQEYWVRRGGRDAVKEVHFDGAEAARPAPGVLDAIRSADVVLLPPSNPVVSIGPILAVPGLREAVRDRRARVAGVSGIVDGAPLAGMADRLLPSLGVEVTAAGVAGHFADVLAGWVIDDADRRLAPRIEAMGIRVAVTDTVMQDDDRAASVARTALELVTA
jgi:LPPG:FO 2-phospho-L-lactate transferase